MAEYKLGEIEKKFAQIIWNNEPLSSGELVKLCEKELSWKKSTTYTILKKKRQMITSYKCKINFLYKKI